MDPTPDPSPAPAPAASEPVVEWIRTQRQNVGYALTAVAAVFLVVGVMLVVKSQRLAAASATTSETKDKDKDDAPTPAPGAELSQSNRFDYMVGAFGMALGLAVTGGAAAYLIVGLPKPTENEQRSEARVLVLIVGGLIGAFLILIGIWFFLRWSDSLVKWLDKGELKEAKYALYPILMAVVGGGLMMLAIQPARAEERNSTTIRRLVYGSNFGLTILILFVVLVIANAVVAMRVPNKLDTTSTGFYSLSPQTKQILEGLEQPVRAFAILPEGSGPIVNDIKRLLSNAQDANPSKFQVKFLSPALNRDDIDKLRLDYPMAEMSDEGVLLVVGEESERKRHSYLRAAEFIDQKEGPDGRSVPTFNGEPKLLREVMFLTENKNRPKVYFTQSSGELALAPTGLRADMRRSATALKAYLEKNYFDVVPLTFGVGTAAKIPDDAAVVVVADPTAPLPPDAVKAIGDFMTQPRPDGKKGKLVVLAGSHPGPDRKSVKTGLEPVLGTFGVRLSDQFLYGQPNNELAPLDNAGGTRVSLALVSRQAAQARNPVALAFAENGFLLLDCRELTAGDTNFQTVILLLSQPGRQTWTQQEYAPAPQRAWQNLVERNRAIGNAKTPEERQALIAAFREDYEVSSQPRPLAVLASEGPTARVAVFGCGWFASDEAAAQTTGQSTTIYFDLMGSTLDWVRDRPTVGVTEKPYTTYTLKPGYDTSRLLYVPLGIGMLIVVSVGAGVWVIRRK